MPDLEIDGIGTIEVDDNFLKLDASQQNAFVQNVARQLKAPKEQPQEQPQEQTSMGEEIARPFLRAGRMVATSIGGIGDIVQEVAHAPEALARTVARAEPFNLDVEPFDYSKVNTVSPMIRKGVDDLTGGLTVPRNKTEEVVDIVGEIASGGLAGGIKTVAKKVVDVASLIGKRTLQKATGMTSKSKELIKAFEDTGVNPTLANIAEGQGTKSFQNLVGNAPGGRGAIERATQDQIDALTKQIAGITKSEGGTITQAGTTIRKGAETFKRGVEGRINKLYDDLDEFIPKEAKTTKSNYEDEFGRNIVKEFDNFKIAVNDPSNPSFITLWDKTSNKKIGELATSSKQVSGAKDYTQIGQVNIDKKYQGQGLATKLYDSLLENLPSDKKGIFGYGPDIVAEKAVPRIYQKLGGSSDSQGNFIIPKKAVESNKIPTNNLKALTQDAQIQDVVAVGSGDTAKVLARYNDIIDEAGNISYPRLKTFRSTVGAKLQSPTLLGDEKGALKKVYGALSQDMKEAVTAQGGEKGLQAFNKANKAFGRHTALLDKKIDPLIKAKTPSKVYDLLVSGTKQGGADTRIMMRSLSPTQKDFVRGTVAREMGLANEGVQGAARDTFSPNKFLTEYNKMRKVGSERHLFTPEQNEAFTKLNKVIESLKETSKARQSSNNLPYMTWAGLGYMLRGGVVGAGATVAGANITSRMMTNPKFIKWLAQTPKIRPAAVSKHIKQLSIIAGSAKSPQLSEDILDYLGSITIEKENNGTK